MKHAIGQASVRLPKPVYLLEAASVVGKMEGEGPLGTYFDLICADDKFGQDTWEEAESQMQKEALGIVLKKAELAAEDLRYIFAGDLLGQTIASSFGLLDFGRPLFGLYGACSTSGEALSLGAMAVAAGYANVVATVTSSHFAGAERQFRFPIEYASQRPLSSTWTVTGSGAFLLSAEALLSSKVRKKENRELDDEKSQVVISELTTGKIVDLGIRDALNMGAAMAPAAADLICTHLEDFGRKPKDYDAIITGDLGAVGKEILLDLCENMGYDIRTVHLDCGMEIFDEKTQHTCAGGSGCGCSAVTMASYFLPKLKRGEWRRVLFVPTGALLSTVSFNEGKNVPGIAHGVVFEYKGDE